MSSAIASRPLLSFPDPHSLALSVRASALVFEDSVSRSLLKRIQQIAPSSANALIVGDTGTGKELVARHLHSLSLRADGPFVAVNCGAFSENLVESELFGYERGAFTGATGSRPGWFEAAQGGTLFLDEIGDLPLPLQVKLLRVLQERQVVRIGSRTAIPIDVRIVAATNVNLEEAVVAGRFRQDLYYRLQVARFDVPPLRERPGDILPLALHFLRMYGDRLEIKNPLLSPESIDVLHSHSWPGNIRELENVIHHALLVCTGTTVRPEDLHLSPVHRVPGAVPEYDSERLEQALIAIFERGGSALFADIEATVMRTAYEYCARNQLQTARLLGISRNIVRARLIQYGALASGTNSVLETPAASIPAQPAI